MSDKFEEIEAKMKTDKKEKLAYIKQKGTPIRVPLFYFMNVEHIGVLQTEVPEGFPTVRL